MPRGGKREGTPGKAYSNRTDLGMDYAPGDAASGGLVAPSQMAQSQVQAPPSIGADDVLNLGAPTERPGEAVTTGIDMGMGSGVSAMGAQPPPPQDPVRQAVEAMMLVNPNPDLARILMRLTYEGR